MSARLRAWFHNSPAAVAPSLTAATDGQLVDQFVATHDEAAFAELVRRHGPMVLATCRRVLHPNTHTADDAFQATFVVLATKAAAVSPPDRVGAFLHGVAVHVARKARAWARTLVSCAPADLDRVPVAPPDGGTDAAELRAAIDDVLAGLPPKYRAAVVLCDLEQRSRAEAAKALGWTEGTLSGRLARARKLLADRLARRGVTAPALVAGGLGVLLPASAALAHVPGQLAASTIRAAALTATRALAGDAVPAPVAALAQGVPMHTATFKLLAASLAGVALALGGFGLYALTAAPLLPQPYASQPRKAGTGGDGWAAEPGRGPTALVAGLRADERPAPSKGPKAKHTFAHKSAVTAVAFGPDLVAAGDKDGVLVLWDAQTGKEKETLLDGTGAGAKPIDRVQTAADGKFLYLVTNGGDNYHQVTVEKEDRIFPGSGSNGQSRSYGVTADGAYWLQAEGARRLALFKNTFADNVIPSERVPVSAHDEDVSLAAGCDAELVATASGGLLRCWGKGKAGPLWKDKLDAFEPTALVACPVSKVFALGGANGETRVYAGLTGKVMVTLKGHTEAVRAVAFSADGKQVATVAGKTVRVHDAETGKELRAITGHDDAVLAVAFAPDGKALVTGSADKTAKVWELTK